MPAQSTPVADLDRKIHADLEDRGIIPAAASTPQIMISEALVREREAYGAPHPGTLPSVPDVASAVVPDFNTKLLAVLVDMGVIPPVFATPEQCLLAEAHVRLVEAQEDPP